MKVWFSYANLKVAKQGPAYMLQKLRNFFAHRIRLSSYSPCTNHPTQLKALPTRFWLLGVFSNSLFTKVILHYGLFFKIMSKRISIVIVDI